MLLRRHGALSKMCVEAPAQAGHRGGSGDSHTTQIHARLRCCCGAGAGALMGGCSAALCLWRSGRWWPRQRRCQWPQRMSAAQEPRPRCRPAVLACPSAGNLQASHAAVLIGDGVLLHVRRSRSAASAVRAGALETRHVPARARRAGLLWSAASYSPTRRALKACVASCCALQRRRVRWLCWEKIKRTGTYPGNRAQGPE